MPRGREALDGPAADPLRGRIGCHEGGVRLLERLELLQQPIEFRVGDLGVVMDVVPLFVVADPRAESGNLLGSCHSHGAMDEIATTERIGLTDENQSRTRIR